MQPPFSQTHFRGALKKERFAWRRHALERLAEREISQNDALAVLERGACIEAYPEDMPHPSALFYLSVRGKPLHAVAAFDAANEEVYIVTVYEPDAEHFADDWRTRIKR